MGILHDQPVLGSLASQANYIHASVEKAKYKHVNNGQPLLRTDMDIPRNQASGKNKLVSEHSGPPQTTSYTSPASPTSAAAPSPAESFVKVCASPDGSPSDEFPRISRPVELMRNSYDCVVIGSGYGGGVAAARMARAGQRVCVLELGKERWPGEYPTSQGEAFRELHCSGKLAPPFLGSMGIDSGSHTGLYHLIFGKGQNAVVANGLGGTSLINANVFLRADADTMAMDAWPPELRQKGALDKYYERVESVLEPEVYPDDWPTLAKLELLKKQASALKMDDKFYKVKQTTRFRNGPNSCGVEMTASSLSGQDCTGLNDGSKTTTLVTYLADAWNWGAEMFCECEVRHIEKVTDARGGYRVYFAWHGRNRGHFKSNVHDDLMWVHARDAVFLGAGAIGTTEILLRSKAMGLVLSDQVGQNMSGNGDMLAYGYNTEHTANAIGQPVPTPDRPVGPTITGVIDNRSGHANPLDGYVIEEGAVPLALAGFLQVMIDLLPGSQFAKGKSVLERAQGAMASVGSHLLGPYFRGGAMQNTQIYLVMSHDSNQAVLSLEDDKPVLEFLGVGRSDHVKYINDILAKATEAVGGRLVGNPFFALMEQQVTVHPIGGASMAEDNTGMTGASDHAGRLFSGNGRAVHEGLIVTDGAAVPTALGVNPLATIAALAERSVQLFADSKGLVIQTEKNATLNLFGEPAHLPPQATPGLDVPTVTVSTSSASSSASSPSFLSTTSTVGESQHEMEEERADELESKGIETADKAMDAAISRNAGGFGFTEVMSGFLHSKSEGLTTTTTDASGNCTDDTRQAYELAYRTGKSLCESARFFLSVQAFDTETLVRQSDHRGMLTGTFVCPTLPGSPYMVHRGAFGLFVRDLRAPGTRNLTYDFDLRGTDGQTLHFHGYKVVDSSVALNPVRLWKATTTLYVTITKKQQQQQQQQQQTDTELDEVKETTAAARGVVVVARGIMRIQAGDFASEVLTMAPTGSGLLRKAMSAASFLHFFTRQSLRAFLGPLAPLQYPSVTVTGFSNETTPTRVWTDICASDGVLTHLYMWEPRPEYVPRQADGRPGKVKNLFMVPGASVDHQIFALPTIPFNAVNYFTRAGYRVFVTVLRIGQLAIAHNNWTTYDARLDIRASLEHIRREYCDGDDEKDKKVYAIAHCMGSVALATGLLDGTIPADWLSGLTCSQVFMNPIWNSANMMKAKAGPVPLDTLYRALAGSWFNCGIGCGAGCNITGGKGGNGGSSILSSLTGGGPPLVQRLLDQVLRFYPDERAEMCSSTACHRATLVFGRCWNHSNLNEATHRHIDRFFGGVNMTLLRLLMRQGSHGNVMANAPDFTVLSTPENINRLRGLPIFFFVGGDNAVLSPMATEKSYEVLCDTFGTTAPVSSLSSQAPGPVNYRRRVIPGYGHLDCWMGRNAWRDVYPIVRTEMDRVVHGEDYRFQEPDASVCRFTRMMRAGEI